VSTTIAQALAKSPAKLALAALIGFIVVAGDLVLVWMNLWYARAAFPLAGLALLLELVDGDRASLGLRITPLQSWSYWARTMLWLCLAMAAVMLACGCVGVALGYDFPIKATPPRALPIYLWDGCFVFPVMEEFIYRVALCVPLVLLMTPWGAIAASGIIFALLHVIYGNSSPENAIGGFILAWVYLKSGSIYLSIALHALGNFLLLVVQVALWYAWYGSV
jgi:membrane protease YdiL (CAAX protease family)